MRFTKTYSPAGARTQDSPQRGTTSILIRHALYHYATRECGSAYDGREQDNVATWGLGLGLDDVTVDHKSPA